MGDSRKCEKCLAKLHERKEATDCYFICHPETDSINGPYEGSRQIHKLSFVYSDDKKT